MSENEIADVAVPVVIYFDDLDFAVRIRVDDYNAYFEVYDIEGTCGNGQRLLHKKDSPCHPDPVESFEDAEVYLHGFVKWDGCSNWHFDEQDRVMLHGCSRECLVRLGEVMARCWDEAKKRIPNWGP